MSMNGKLLALVGPTACGKTALSIQATNALNAEIISADSVQLYKRLNIGSAKPTPQERAQAPHHLVDCVALDLPVSVAEYQQMAFEIIETLFSRGKQPLIVGGTGLYVNSLTTAMDFAAPPADPALRAELLSLAPAELHRRLAAVDPQSAARLHENDVKRVARALEVYYTTGKTFTVYSRENAEKQPRYPCVIAGLTMPRALLYERIERRVDQMLADGLVDEVRSILRDGYDPALQSLQGLGYKEIIAHLQNKCTLNEAVAEIKLQTRHFAKRQWTWFNRDKRIRWIDVSECPPEENLRKLLTIFEEFD